MGTDYPDNISGNHSINTNPFRMNKGIQRLMDKIGARHYWRSFASGMAIYIMAFSLAFVFVFPFIYMIITSLKSPEDLLDLTVQWVPRSIFWKNYVIALRSLNYWMYFKNSVFVTFICIAGHILSCSFIAYGFSRFHFPGRNILFSLVLLTIMVPAQVVIIPQYMAYSSFGWTNTYLPLTVPTFFGFGLRGGLYIFIFRQFFMGLPAELENAARIDGCGPLKTFLKIVLPTSQTAILASSVIAMVWHWNDYFEPVIYLTKANKLLLPAMLPMMYELAKKGVSTEDLAAGTEVIFNDAVVMAGVFLVILPILLAYVVLQRRFMQGVERTGLVE